MGGAVFSSSLFLLGFFFGLFVLFLCFCTCRGRGLPSPWGLGLVGGRQGWQGEVGGCEGLSRSD